MPSLSKNRFIVGILSLIVFGLFVGLLSEILVISGELPDWSIIKAGLSRNALPVNSAIYDQTGREIAELGGGLKRYVSLNEMPKRVIDAVLCAEDANFYEHWGVSLSGVFRAAISNLLGHGWLQGGSTITQQLVRNQFLSRQKTLARKVREVILAFAVERHFSKSEILELYMNSVYLGTGTFGFDAASRRYFGKPLSQITTAQAATLAALLQAPSRYSSKEGLSALTERKNLVLALMKKSGAIDSQEFANALKQSVRLNKIRYDAGSLGYLVNAVSKIVSRKFELSGLADRGLKISTSLTLLNQKKLERELDYLREIKIPQVEDGSDQQVAGVTVDSSTGAILAIIGGSEFKVTEFDRAQDMRRPVGRLFDVFAFALAFENGFGLSAAVGKMRGSENIVLRHPNGALLVPSSEEIFGVLGLGVGERFLKSLGATRVAQVWGQNLLSIAASPLEVAIAYSSLLNGGKVFDPFLVTEITDLGGAKIYRAPKIVGRPVMSAEAALSALTLARSQGYNSGKLLRVAVSDSGRNSWFVSAEGSVVTVAWHGTDGGGRVKAKTDEEVHRSYLYNLSQREKTGEVNVRY